MKGTADRQWWTFQKVLEEGSRSALEIAIVAKVTKPYICAFFGV